MADDETNYVMIACSDALTSEYCWSLRPSAREIIIVTESCLGHEQLPRFLRDQEAALFTIHPCNDEGHHALDWIV
jgi:hypothetical protein